jgi:hypothetical protein
MSATAARSILPDAPINYRVALQIFTKPNPAGPEICHTVEFTDARLILREGKYLLDKGGKDGSLMLKYQGIYITRATVHE